MGTATTLRRHFHRTIGVPPDAYRRTSPGSEAPRAYEPNTSIPVTTSSTDPSARAVSAARMPSMIPVARLRRTGQAYEERREPGSCRRGYRGERPDNLDLGEILQLTVHSGSWRRGGAVMRPSSTTKQCWLIMIRYSLSCVDARQAHGVQTSTWRRRPNCFALRVQYRRQSQQPCFPALSADWPSPIRTGWRRLPGARSLRIAEVP
jgi:hypothetical protein